MELAHADLVKSKPIHTGFTVIEKGVLDEQDTFYGDDMTMLTSLYGFSNEDLEIAISKGRAENQRYVVEPIFS